MREEFAEKRATILQAMEHTVPEADWAAAEDLVDLYQEDRLGLTLLDQFYSCPPDAREEWVREIRMLNRHRGVFLLVAITPWEKYLYLVSSEGIEFHGSMAEGYLTSELLDFFGYETAADFKAICAAVDDIPVYEPLRLDEDICPACHTGSGELHELGCPVEVCPWCGGQLIYCDCRFEQLGLDSIATEEELLRLEVLLEQRGRIPYASEQRPGYLDEGSVVLLE
ncbi:hypothetical protein [Desulfobulbus alkaliphilus]|uniref:hypothetical protein n=1 Tax=Desulfobulbus alkaliphilus TaxID=869814 RepID=UPI0019629CB3|nr:hypothetical protein [Desulfobulbus alkaliphilus]MBM9535962.1 hypothetical protein [Desulfobulbus alkaliphilus]